MTAPLRSSPHAGVTRTPVDLASAHAHRVPLLRWLTRPEPARLLVPFRIGVAGFFLVRLWTVRDALQPLYGEHGWVGWSVSRREFAGIPHLADLQTMLVALGVDSAGLLRMLWLAQAGALVALLCGVWARAGALSAWLIDLLLMHAGAATLYGADYFAHVALSYCVIMPLGAMRRFGARTAEPSVAAGLTRKLLQCQLAIVYTASGLAKASGPQWWNGEAIWRVLNLPSLRQYDPSWLAFHPWLPTLAGWVVIAIECAYGPALWWHKTRPLWLALVIGMHCGIAFALGMFSFAAIMIILTTAAFAPDARHLRGR